MVRRRALGRVAVAIAAVLFPIAALAEPAAAGTVPQDVIVSSGTNVILGQAPWQVAATATSGLAVTFASDTPTTCSVAGDMVTFTAVGRCRVLASQAGDDTWAPAAAFIYFDVQYLTFLLDQGADKTVRTGGNLIVTSQLRILNGAPISDALALQITCVRTTITIGSQILQGCATYSRSTDTFRLTTRLPRTITRGQYLTNVQVTSTIGTVTVGGGSRAFNLTVV